LLPLQGLFVSNPEHFNQWMMSALIQK